MAAIKSNSTTDQPSLATTGTISLETTEWLPTFHVFALLRAMDTYPKAKVVLVEREIYSCHETFNEEVLELYFSSPNLIL